MDERVVEFIRGLRAAGVRVSLAESMDALRAVGALGITNKEVFQASLRATLIKEQDDFAAFDQLFPLYFGSGGPPLQNAMDELTPDEQGLVEAALAALSGRLQQLMDWLTSGNGPTKEELEELANRAGAQWATDPREARWISRRMLQQMGFAHLEEQIQKMRAELEAMGMSQEAIAKLMGVVEANQEALAEQVAQQVGQQIAEQRAQQADEMHGSDLLHKPIANLTDADIQDLRVEVRRLVQQLRTRAALRRKRGTKGKFDAKSTIRANQRYGGVPVEIRYKKNKLKPSLVLMCDMSRSMYHVTEFMLYLIYELQDQVSRTRSFAFYSDMQEVSDILAANRAEDATREVFDAFYQKSPGHYATNLGRGLETFHQNWMDAVDGRTTIVVLGDGRNNYNSPRADLLQTLQRRARKLVWLNPEMERQWQEGDSDMLTYAPLCDHVFVVRNLAQLAMAVDSLLTDH